MTQKFSFINDPNIFIDNASLSYTENMGQKLFCTFVLQSELDETLNNITKRYTILYNKIFVLKSPQSEELICTYNIDTHNTVNTPMPHTILLHRKKESNTLYTINALNTLIRSLNGGVLDNKFIIDWINYRNSILLTSGPDIRKLDTSIHTIINL
jgi:hypothetical protein